jgi:hypothetical protein
MGFVSSVFPAPVTNLISLFLSHSQKQRLQSELHQYSLAKERTNVGLLRFSIYSIFSLFFNVINSVEEINPYLLPVSLFDGLPTSHKHIISSLIFRSKLFHSVAIIKVSQKFFLKYQSFLAN